MKGWVKRTNMLFKELVTNKKNHCGGCVLQMDYFSRFPAELLYLLFEFIGLKHFTMISKIIGCDINNITKSYDIVVNNTDDFVQAFSSSKIDFKHVIFKNIITNVDGEKLINCKGISGDKITIVCELQKNVINMAVFLKCFKRCFVEINANNRFVFFNVICNLLSRDEEQDYFIEIRFNNARVKIPDFSYSIGRIHHLIFHNCFPMNENEIQYILSSCDKITFE